MGFRWPALPGSGGAQVARSIGAIGAGIGALGEELNTQQAEVEYQDFKLRQKARIDALGDTLETNTDENTYLSETNKVISQMQSDMPKNGLAQRFASAWVKNEIPILNAAANESIKRRIKDKSDVKQGQLIEDAIRTGNVVDLAEHTIARVGFGYISGAQAQKVLADTRNKVEYEAGLNWSLTNPTELLNSFKTVNGKNQLEGFVTLTQGQLISLRSNAEGTENFNKRRKTEAVSAGKGQISTVAWDAMVNGDYALAQKTILSAPDRLGTAWKKAELTKLSEASKLLNDKGVNPYTDRQDDAAYQRAIERALNETLTVDEANEGVGKDWTINDGTALRKIINDGGTAQNFRNSSMVKTFLAQIQRDRNFEVRGIEENQGLRWLEAWSKEHPDATQREADEQALRVYERVVREDIAGTLPATADELRNLREKAEAKTGVPGSKVRTGGQVIGTIDDEGALVLNRNGVERLKRITGGNTERAREIIKERGWKVGK